MLINVVKGYYNDKCTNIIAMAKTDIHNITYHIVQNSNFCIKATCGPFFVRESEKLHG